MYAKYWRTVKGMIKDTQSVANWIELMGALTEVSNQQKSMKAVGGSSPSDLLYRGHANANWPLTTKLERAGNPQMTLLRYYRHLFLSRPEVEAFSGKSWDLPTIPEFEMWEKDTDPFFLNNFPGYEFMIYLRHHGFPSPLLDWTRSPYIAAFFAFHNIPQDADLVAIFCFVEYGTKGKSHFGNEPHIATKGPYARSHKRHFLQQCDYTICTRHDGTRLQYANHDDAFALDHDDQDILWKITAPASIATEALAELDSMNINALSLFDSEDGLIDTMAFRQFDHN